MVRETRFSFDGDPHQRPDTTPEDFTEEDDLFLDAFSPPTEPDHSAKTGASRRRKKTGNPEDRTPNSTRCRDQRRGHLSDADWLTPPKQKEQQAKRKSAG